jgi:hypothetical protein
MSSSASELKPRAAAAKIALAGEQTRRYAGSGDVRFLAIAGDLDFALGIACQRLGTEVEHELNRVIAQV